MRLFDSVGPNPRVVRMVLAEKQVELPRVLIDLRGGENRREPYVSTTNPAGTTPALELDDGRMVSEIVPICEYLEELYPEPGLFGATAEERLVVRMWTRRIDLKIAEPMTSGFRYSQGLKMFQDRMRCLPEAADGLKAIAQDGLAWLDAQIAGRDWIAGDAFTFADIMLFAFLDFGRGIGQPTDPAHANIACWFDRVAARPSATASAQP